MCYVRNALTKLKLIKIDVREADLSPAEYDLCEINRRASLAITRTGRTRIEVAEMFGMDTSIPIAMQPRKKIPRPTMDSIIKMSNFLGVSVRWLLYGEPQNDVDLFVMHQVAPAQGTTISENRKNAHQGAAIITGAHNSTVVVQNIKMESLSEMEREMVEALRRLPLRDQAAAMAYVFSLEKEHEEGKNAPSA